MTCGVCGGPVQASNPLFGAGRARPLCLTCLQKKARVRPVKRPGTHGKAVFH